MNKWLALALNFAPYLLLGIPGMPPVLVPVIAHGIQEAEQIAGASGADKKAHVMAIAGDAVAAVNASQGRQVVDPAVLTTVVSGGIDTTVGILNMVRDAHAPAAAAV